MTLLYPPFPAWLPGMLYVLALVAVLCACLYLGDKLIEFLLADDPPPPMRTAPASRCASCISTPPHAASS